MLGSRCKTNHICSLVAHTCARFTEYNAIWLFDNMTGNVFKGAVKSNFPEFSEPWIPRVIDWIEVEVIWIEFADVR